MHSFWRWRSYLRCSQQAGLFETAVEIVADCQTAHRVRLALPTCELRRLCEPRRPYRCLASPLFFVQVSVKLTGGYSQCISTIPFQYLPCRSSGHFESQHLLVRLSLLCHRTFLKLVTFPLWLLMVAHRLHQLFCIENIPFVNDLQVSS